MVTFNILYSEIVLRKAKNEVPACLCGFYQLMARPLLMYRGETDRFRDCPLNFTTKETGNGTGLGLSISYGIIQDHGGTVRVKSEENKGTNFTVCLPAMGEQQI